MSGLKHLNVIHGPSSVNRSCVVSVEDGGQQAWSQESQRDTLESWEEYPSTL